MTSQRASSRSGPVRGSRAHGGLGWRGARAACPAKRDERLVGHIGTLSLMISSPSFLLRFPLPDALVRRMAIHEAGHAAVGLAIDAGEISSVSISISAARRREGRREMEFYSKCLGFERTGAQMLDDMAVRPGGLAAEEVFLGDRSAGAGGAKGADLHGATSSALAFEASYGFGEGFSSSDEEELFAALRHDRYLQLRVDKVLAGQFERAKKIEEGHRQEVELIAEALLAKGTLTGAELRDLSDLQPRLKLVTDVERKAARPSVRHCSQLASTLHVRVTNELRCSGSCVNAGRLQRCRGTCEER